jgi:hypothetical protein
MNATSTPYSMHGRPLVGGMLPTPIGTPLNEMMEVEDLRYGYQYNGANNNRLSRVPEDPVFRHMTHPDELAKSRQIIQIGAMVVKNRSRLDPRLKQTGTDTRERILKKLADIEEHLEETKGDEALRGCRMIREALGKKMEAEDIANTVDDDGPENLEVPNKILDCDMYDGDNGNALMDMLMRQNGVHPQKQEDDSSDE